MTSILSTSSMLYDIETKLRCHEFSECVTPSDICLHLLPAFRVIFLSSWTHALDASVPAVWGNTLMHKIIRYDRTRGLAFFLKLPAELSEAGSE